MTVSITTVMPAYNEGDRLFAFLHDWASTSLHHQSLQATALVVDDGSGAEEAARQREAVDAAAELLRKAGSCHRVAYVRADRNKGKGAAIRWGWSQADASAAWLSFIDSDGAVPANEYWRIADMLAATPADALCGSRVNMAGRSVSRSWFRLLQGRTFATVVDKMFHLGLYDTQCGMKFFRAARLRPLLDNLREDQWLLDIEVLSLLKADRAQCVEVPIDCHERGGSALAGLDPLKMLIGLVRLRRRLRDRTAAA